MFRNSIPNTPLTSEQANICLQNIRGESYGGDLTFVSTLRALLGKRINKDEKVFVEFSGSSYNKELAESNSGKRLLKALCGWLIEDDGEVYNNMIVIHSLNNSTEDNEAVFSVIDNSFERNYPEWHRLSKITDFYRKSFYVSCFINPEEKKVIIFVDNLDIRKMHYLQCSILAFLPWYFDPEKGISELEMKLINSLREKTSNTYEDCIAEIASQYDFRTQSIKNLLAGFETRFIQKEYNDLKISMTSCMDAIRNYNAKISELLSQKYEFETRMLGLQASLKERESSDSEIMEYFLCNKKLVLEDVNNDKMTFACWDYLTYFDDEMAKEIIDNEHSYVYYPDNRNCSGIISHDDMKKLMYALFVDQTLRMKVCAAYSFNLRGRVGALSDYNYGYEFRECTPNTHIDKYRCMGNYEPTINKLLMDNDYIGAIEQCVASCKSLNFGDSTVMDEFMLRLYGLRGNDINIRCIELPTGEVVKPKKAIDWLNAQENSQEQETHEEVTQEGDISNE